MLDSLHQLEESTVKMCRDQLRCFLAHIPESEDGPAEPEGDHSSVPVSCSFLVVVSLPLDGKYLYPLYNVVIVIYLTLF